MSLLSVPGGVDEASPLCPPSLPSLAGPDLPQACPLQGCPCVPVSHPHCLKWSNSKGRGEKKAGSNKKSPEKENANVKLSLLMGDDPFGLDHTNQVISASKPSKTPETTKPQC